MLKIDQRRQQILTQLERDGRVYVAQLGEALGATPATIRNDLTALEREGRLVRVQGGALHASSQAGLGPCAAEKLAIGQRVASHVRNGDRLFINSGSTVLAVAQALAAFRELHIITNALPLAQQLGERFHVLVLGGELNARAGFSHGEDALMQLARYQADWAILSVDSISAADGVTLCHSEETAVSRMMLERAARGIIAADHSKVGRAGFVRVCPAAAPLMLVTDPAADRSALRALEGKGIEIDIA